MCPLLLGSQLRVAKSDDQSKPSTELVNPALMPEPLKERVAAAAHTCLLWPFTMNPVHGHQPATGMPVSSSADLHTAHNQSHQTLYTCRQPGLMPLSPRTPMATRSAPSWELRWVCGHVIWWIIPKCIIWQIIT